MVDVTGDVDNLFCHRLRRSKAAAAVHFASRSSARKLAPGVLTAAVSAFVHPFTKLPGPCHTCAGRSKRVENNGKARQHYPSQGWGGGGVCLFHTLGQTVCYDLSPFNFREV